MHVGVHPMDPARGSTFASAELGPFQPHDFDFPVRNFAGQMRSFLPSWFDKFPWIEYSPNLDAAFCFPCRLFSKQIEHCNCDQAFVTVGYKQWKKALEKGRGLKGHAISDSHKLAMTLWAESRPLEKSVKVQLDSSHSRDVQKHLHHLEKITETIMWLGKQGLPLRGHDESHDSLNRGNFLELLDLRSVDNQALRKYLDNETFTYTSADVQNELIEIIGDLIQKNIVDTIKTSGAFSFILDGTQDISVHEQLSFCVRYVDSNFDVCESFLGFWDSPKSEAASLLAVVEQVFDEVGLTFEMLRGQCYDGAANMTGCHTGLGVRILEKQPMAPFVHCWSHQANLVLLHACSPVKEIRNTLNRIQTSYKFFSSHKRQDVLRDMQSQNEVDRVRSLKSHCDTRWSSWLAAVRDLRATLDSVYQSLIIIDENDHSVRGSDAGQLASSLQSFSFIFCLEFLYRVFTITDCFSKDLQSAEIDIETARRKAEIVITAIEGLRSDPSFQDIWTSTVSLAGKINVEEPVMPSRPTRRPARYEHGTAEGHVFATASDEYKAMIYYPVIDHICGELRQRFCTQKHVILEQLYHLLMSFNDKDELSPEIIASVSAFYNLNADSLKAELHVLKNSDGIRDIDDIKQLGKYLVKMSLVTWFPLLCYLMRVYLSLPVSSSTSERSFSQLKLIKDEKRSTVLQTRLRGLALMKIESRYLSAIDVSKVVQIFVSRKNRRQKFL